MPSLQTLAVQEVRITWVNDGSSNGAWTFDPGGPVVFSENLALITYRLTPQSTPGATFDTTPVVWVFPTTQPANVAMSLSADQLSVHFADVNVATKTSSQSFTFFLQVLLGSTVFQSPDPTIVNTEPPTGMVTMKEQGSSIAA
jgi:hypothetical protein